MTVLAFFGIWAAASVAAGGVWAVLGYVAKSRHTARPPVTASSQASTPTPRPDTVA